LSGKNALHIAAMSGHTAVVTLLLTGNAAEHGMCCSTRDCAWLIERSVM